MVVPTLKEEVFSRIKAHGSESVFTLSDFFDLAKENDLEICFSELAKSADIRRIFLGEQIYRYYDEKTSLRNGNIAFDPFKIILAIGRQHNWTLIPTKDYALYFSGLLNKMPKVLEVASNGEDCEYENDEILIKIYHQETPVIGKLSFNTEVLLQSIMYLGKDGLTDTKRADLRKHLTAGDRTRISGEIIGFTGIPSWVFTEIKNICKR